MSILNLLGGSRKITEVPTSDFWVYVTSTIGSTWIHQNIRFQNGKLDPLTRVELSRVAGAHFLGFNKARTFAFINSSSIAAYPYVPGSPWGARASSSPSSAYGARSLDVSPAGNLIAAGFDSTYTLLLFPWSDTTYFGARILPASTYRPAGAVHGVKFSPSGRSLIIGTLGGTVKTRAFVISGDGVITGEFPAPAGIGSLLPVSIHFSPTGDVVYLYGSEGTNFAAYRWSDDTGFGEKLSGNSVVGSPNNTTNGKKMFIPSSGNRIVLASDASDLLRHRLWDTSTGDLGPAPLPAGMTGTYSVDVALSPAEDVVVRAGGAAGDRLECYRWSNVDGFGSKIALGFDPAVLGNIQRIGLHP